MYSLELRISCFSSPYLSVKTKTRREGLCGFDSYKQCTWASVLQNLPPALPPKGNPNLPDGLEKFTTFWALSRCVTRTKRHNSYYHKCKLLLRNLTKQAPPGSAHGLISLS